MRTFDDEYYFDGTDEGKMYSYFNRAIAKTKRTNVRVLIGSERNLELYFQNVGDEILQEMRALCTTEFLDTRDIPNFFLKLRNCTQLEILESKLVI